MFPDLGSDLSVINKPKFEGSTLLLNASDLLLANRRNLGTHESIINPGCVDMGLSMNIRGFQHSPEK
jgi:hypothetical protein